MYSLVSKVRKIIKRALYRPASRLAGGTSPLIDKKGLMTLMDGHAYIHDDEIALFADMARKAKGTIVEIGCAFGASSSIFLAHSAKGVNLHSIDPFVQDSMRPFQATQEICAKNVARILKWAHLSEKYSDWTQHPDYSFNVIKNWKEPVEMIFIDGDHNYEAVKGDYRDWFPVVKKGGYILFHDSRKEVGSPTDTFNRGWAGPTKFVAELKSLSDVTLVREAFSVTVWQKN